MNHGCAKVFYDKMSVETKQQPGLELVKISTQSITIFHKSSKHYSCLRLVEDHPYRQL